MPSRLTFGAVHNASGLGCVFVRPSLVTRLSTNRPRILSATRVAHGHPSSSTTRWKNRQGKDAFAREARVRGLKSRAAFKLLEIDSKYRLFRKGQTVVDLGYAPGSWSQVAVERTKPNGRVVGIDVIPAQPPKGVSTIQGNFLSPSVQTEVKAFLSNPSRGRLRAQPTSALEIDREEQSGSLLEATEVCNDQIYPIHDRPTLQRNGGPVRKAEALDASGKTVDIVLSDMSAPWEQTSGFWKRSLSDPYIRMMNTSGINFKDHAGSMDLCAAALRFAHDTLRVGGHFVCKFYQGAEDKNFEVKLRTLFKTVHREKPESSRSESKEAFFVALCRKSSVDEALEDK